jgi:hypothetical protein
MEQELKRQIESQFEMIKMLKELFSKLNEKVTLLELLLKN